MNATNTDPPETTASEVLDILANVLTVLTCTMQALMWYATHRAQMRGGDGGKAQLVVSGHEC